MTILKFQFAWTIHAITNLQAGGTLKRIRTAHYCSAKHRINQWKFHLYQKQHSYQSCHRGDCRINRKIMLEKRFEGTSWYRNQFKPIIQQRY